MNDGYVGQLKRCFSHLVSAYTILPPGNRRSSETTSAAKQLLIGITELGMLLGIELGLIETWASECDADDSSKLMLHDTIYAAIGRL